MNDFSAPFAAGRRSLNIGRNATHASMHRFRPASACSRCRTGTNLKQKSGSTDLRTGVQLPSPRNRLQSINYENRMITGMITCRLLSARPEEPCCESEKSSSILISTRIALSGLRAQAYLWSEYAIAFASDSPASSRSVGTPKLSNRSVTWGFSQISMLRQSSPPLASLSRRFAILTVCPK